MTTADYTSGALQKASTSIPRVLTLNGDQVVSIMVEHRLGLKTSSLNAQKLDIDPDYFVTFETMKDLLVSKVKETPQHYHANTSASDASIPLDEPTIDLKPEEDLISLNALGYALRVDPTRVRHWVENETLRPDMSQTSGERIRYYFRRDRIEQMRSQQINTRFKSDSSI